MSQQKKITDVEPGDVLDVSFAKNGLKVLKIQSDKESTTLYYNHEDGRSDEATFNNDASVFVLN
jgi:hypothetical protein